MLTSHQALVLLQAKRDRDDFCAPLVRFVPYLLREFNKSVSGPIRILEVGPWPQSSFYLRLKMILDLSRETIQNLIVA